MDDMTSMGFSPSTYSVNTLVTDWCPGWSVWMAMLLLFGQEMGGCKNLPNCSVLSICPLPHAGFPKNHDVHPVLFHFEAWRVEQWFSVRVVTGRKVRLRENSRFLP